MGVCLLLQYLLQSCSRGPAVINTHTHPRRAGGALAAALDSSVFRPSEQVMMMPGPSPVTRTRCVCVCVCVVVVVGGGRGRAGLTFVPYAFGFSASRQKDLNQLEDGALTPLASLPPFLSSVRCFLFPCTSPPLYLRHTAERPQSAGRWSKTAANLEYKASAQKSGREETHREKC